ncbi:MAG: hypothetical protein JWO13_746 [Acidobacteriales bacterium]|nr:hypothetical protein [Terriglobales bacterium]
MAISNDKVFGIVKNLIEADSDSQQGYRDAAEKVREPELRRFFNERSIERGQYAAELQSEIQHFGSADVDVEGSAGGTIRRLWMDLKASLGGTDHAILSSIEAAEDGVKKVYQEALNENLPDNLSSLIRTQAQNIFSAHDYIRRMRDRKAAA